MAVSHVHNFVGAGCVESEHFSHAEDFSVKVFCRLHVIDEEGEVIERISQGSWMGWTIVADHKLPSGGPTMIACLDWKEATAQQEHNACCKKRVGTHFVRLWKVFGSMRGLIRALAM